MKRKVATVLATVIMFIVMIPIFAKAAELPVDEKYGAYCEEIGAKYNICPELLEAIIEQESSGNPNAVGVYGDIGLMQVIPKWHRDRMDRLGVEDLTDEYGNILVATDYLAELFSEYEDIFHVSVGEEMQDMHLNLKLVAMYRLVEEYKAVHI